jgi:hypothetical protein
MEWGKTSGAKKTMDEVKAYPSCDQDCFNCKDVCDAYIEAAFDEYLFYEEEEANGSE